MSNVGLCLWGSGFFFPFQYSIFPASFIEIFLSPSHCLGALVKNYLLKFSLKKFSLFLDFITCIVDLSVHLFANTTLILFFCWLCMGSVVAACGLSCPVTCGILVP